MTHRVETRDRLVRLVCAGLSLREAAVEVGVSAQSASRWWGQCGRMELQLAAGHRGGLLAPVPPAIPVPVPVPAAVPGRGAGRRALSSEDRAVIAAGHRRGLAFAAIGELIGRDKSVVWRELRRNASHNGEYHASVAHRVAAVQRRRPKPFKLVDKATLCGRIEEWMDQGWSPGLIAAMLAVDHGD
jgi:IS30 family transposase